MSVKQDIIDFMRRAPDERKAQSLSDLGTDESTLAAWKEANRAPGKRKAPPELREMAQAVREGKLSMADYKKWMMEHYPPTKFETPPELVSPQKIAGAVGSKALDKGIVGTSTKVPEGMMVGSRLDIPAYNNHDIWAETLHAGREMPEVPNARGKPTSKGAPIGYGQAIKLDDVDYPTFPDASMRIATGEKNKAPFAQINGKYRNADPEALRKEMQGDEWVQVGMNPERSGAFYNKDTLEPLHSSDSMIQVGADVRAKNPKYRSPDDPALKTKDGVVFGLDGGKGGMMQAAANSVEGAAGQARERKEEGVREGIESALAQKLQDLGIIDDAEKARETASWAGLVADFMPVIGDIGGAVDIYDSLKEKDWAGAAINTGLTALGLIPGVGDALAAGGKKAWQAARRRYL